MAQLHQLRGRVGRRSAASACVLLAEPTTEDAKQRLEAMSQTSDGFAIAERDLEIRGTGQIVGARQSGRSGLRVAAFPEDFELLGMARRDAQEWVEASAGLRRAGDALLRSRMIKAYGQEMETAGIA